MTRAWLRPLADDDLVARAAYCAAEAGPALAERFVEEAIRSLRAAERSPGAGSPRVGELCGIDGLRDWSLRGFPVRWYYLTRPDRLDVVRLLADAQDLVAILGDDS